MFFYLSALLAVLLPSAEASLLEYTSLLQMPPLCDMCIEMASETFLMTDVIEKSTRIEQICYAYPEYVRTSDPAFASTCANETLWDGEPAHFCSKMGLCPTQCAYCDSRAETKFEAAWDSTVNMKQFCQHQASKYQNDYGFCIGRAIEFSKMESEFDRDVNKFCYGGQYPCSTVGANGPDDTWVYNPGLAKCNSFADEKYCGNGEVSRNYENHCTPIMKLDTSHRATTDVQLLCMSDICSYTESCHCYEGFTQDAAGSCLVVDTEVGAGEADAEEITSLAVRKSHIYSRSAREKQGNDRVSEEFLTAAIQTAQELHKAQLEPVFDCENEGWTYFTDSPVDGVTYVNVGPLSDHEYFAWAIRQNVSMITMAINLNLPPQGQVMSDLTVSMGDWFVNPMQDDGTFKPLPEANLDGTLFGIRMDATNDNGDALGVYEEAVFTTVANTNNGFQSVSQYIHEIEQMSSTTNPTAAYVKFGGGIDKEGFKGLSYLGEVPLNLMETGKSSYIGPLTGPVEYYIHEDMDDPDQKADLETVRDDYGLLWKYAGGIGINTRIWRFNREYLPGPEDYYRFHVAAECYNEVVGGVVKLCGVPSVTPTPSQTPSRSATRTVTASISRTATASESFSRTPTASNSASSAPSFYPVTDQCECLDYGNEDFGITTLTLGDFEGSSGTQGRLFVCGNAILKSYSVSNGLPSSDDRDDLVVQGDLTFTSGRVNAGNIVYGGEPTIGLSVTQGMLNRSIKHDTDRFDCTGANTYYTVLSEHIGKQQPSGVWSLSDSGLLTFKRVGAFIYEIFDIDCEQLVNVSAIRFSGLPGGQTAIINWHGEQCDFTKISMVPHMESKLIFNFVNATEINIHAASLTTMILAPLAHVCATSGSITGQIIVRSWSGSVQQNYNECTGCIDKINPWKNPLNVFVEKVSQFELSPSEETISGSYFT